MEPIAEVLEIVDDAAAGWLVEQAGPEAVRVRDTRLHLLIGDSIASRSGLRTWSSGDQILNRARGGATWASLEETLTTNLQAWQVEAAASGARLGTAIIWENGNELYSRYTLKASFSEADLEAVRRIAKRVLNELIRRAEGVLILGPLPRPGGELLGTEWSHTAAYRLERTLLTLADDDRVKMAALGRRLTRRMGRRGQGIWGVEQWFTDGVHLSPSGYAKVADATTFPSWLCLG